MGVGTLLASFTYHSTVVVVSTVKVRRKQSPPLLAQCAYQCHLYRHLSTKRPLSIYTTITCY